MESGNLCFNKHSKCVLKYENHYCTGSSSVSCATPHHMLHLPSLMLLLEIRLLTSCGVTQRDIKLGTWGKGQGTNIFEHYVLNSILHMLYICSKTLPLMQIQVSVIGDGLLSSSQHPLPNRWRENLLSLKEEEMEESRGSGQKLQKMLSQEDGSQILEFQYFLGLISLD